MKNNGRFALVFLLMTAISCRDRPGTPPDVSYTRDLEAQLRAQQTAAGQSTKLLGEILADLNAMDDDIQVARAADAETGFVTMDVQAEIRSRLETLQGRLEAAKARERELKQLSGGRGDGASGMAKALVELRRLLETKEREIAELRTEVARLAEENQRLNEQNTSLSNQTAALSLALESEKSQREEDLARLDTLREASETYLLVGDDRRISAAKKEGILRSRSWVLELDPGALAGDRFLRYFSRVDGSETRISIPRGTRKIKIRSVHSKYENLFRIEKSSGQLTLRLVDPAAFWQVSRFLVVELD